MPARSTHDAAKTELERQKFRTQLETALKEEDDPLAVYDQFVQWTLKNYGENNPESGLLELLEQATRQFKGDPLYKTDLRYLKLWSLYAAQVDRPSAIAIYAYLLANDIGTSYSILYEGYASLLEADGRRQDAENIYRKGIKRQARPLERLKTRYKDFQRRIASTSALPPPPPSSSSSKLNAGGDALRRKPPKNHASQSRSASASSSAPTSSSPLTSVSSTPESRYAYMLAPPAPGKRPEKLRFNLSLLFTEDNVEYSIQEARARSMGLLGKKWGPPPASEFSRSSSYSKAVDFNDDGQKSTRIMGAKRKSLMGGAEPTVTINTKEALADVFGMYNSPEKTTRLMGVPGSKHAPLKKVEPKTPATIQRPTFSQENENAVQNSKTAFRPFVDENLQSNKTTPGPMKFTPYVDPSSTSNKAPLTSRPALSLKDSVGPPSNPKNATRTVSKLSAVSEAPLENGFSSKVFTPAQKLPPLAPLRDVFTDHHGEPQLKPKWTQTHERAKSQHDISSSGNEVVPRTPAFTPFIDEDAKTPFKVFSRPPEESENALTPKAPAPAAFAPAPPKPTFTPFRDGSGAFTPYLDQKPETEPTGLQEQATTSCSNAAVEPPLIEDQEIEQSEEDYEYDDDTESNEQHDPQLGAGHYEYEYEDPESYQEEIPLGGRFGKFNVMTPIAERTYEFTSSTRVASTPSERLRHIPSSDTVYESVFVPPQRDEHGAAIAAERLAAELREDASQSEGEKLEPLRLPHHAHPVEIPRGKTGELSLGDKLALNSSFRPPNPCNPFEPSVMTNLLSRIPSDPHYYDLRDRDSNMLDGLQRFAKKSSRTTSDGLSEFPVVLDGHKFSVSEKLGEGGFGAVFKAKDMGAKRGVEGESDDDLEDEDEEEASLVAIKVVKPRNVWEYHVLRRLHTVLPASLRRSVILPHALYAFRDESFLVLNYCPQGTLLNIVNGAVAAGVSQQGACLDELLVVFFTIEILRLIEACHNAGFIHGDLKIDNCLLRLEDVPGGGSAWSSVYQPSGEGGWGHKGLKVIDFGRTLDTRLFPADQQYIADWDTDDRDCFEIRENKPWTYQTDYFGLAGIIYCMLFGKYIQASSVATAASIDGGNTRYKISTAFKRYWQTELWNKLFDVLLNPCLVKPNGQLPVSEDLGDLRRDMESWLQTNCNRTSGTLKGLLKKVEVSCYIR